jgi:hypothetical protein
MQMRNCQDRKWRREVGDREERDAPSVVGERELKIRIRQKGLRKD